MTAVRIIAMILLLTAASACDFPSDPPLKSGDDVVVPPPDQEPRKQLLPLREGNTWVFVAVPRSGAPTDPLLVSPRKLALQGEIFFYLRYGLLRGGPAGPEFAFPPLLQNDSTGLGFYLPLAPDDTLVLRRSPRHIFSLPYPARPGTVVEAANGEYTVKLTHTDTLLTHYSANITLPCHRYEVLRKPRHLSVFYVVPGNCILRVDTDGAVYHTVAWRLR